MNSNSVGEGKDQDNEAWDSWDPMVEDFKAATNNLSLNPVIDPICQITGQVRPLETKIGHVTICDHFARYGYCADAKYCDRLHVDPFAREKLWALQYQCELNKDRLIVTSSFLSPIELEPDVNKLILVSITNKDKINDFSLIAPYEGQDLSQMDSAGIEFYIDRVKTKSTSRVKLMKIHQDLKAMFDRAYRVDNPNDEIYLSQIVACRMNDGFFRRAMVIEAPTPKIDGDQTYTLSLIDIGEKVKLPRSDIYDIKASYLSEPPLAFNGRLAIKPLAHQFEWSEELLAFFDIWTEVHRFFLCKLISYSEMDTMFTVDIVDYQTRTSLTEEIVKRGLADKTLH